jgi:hypothetical protein
MDEDGIFDLDNLPELSHLSQPRSLSEARAFKAVIILTMGENADAENYFLIYGHEIPLGPETPDNL